MNCDSGRFASETLLEVAFEETVELRLWLQVLKGGGERLEKAHLCPISEYALVSTGRMAGHTENRRVASRRAGNLVSGVRRSTLIDSHFWAERALGTGFDDLAGTPIYANPVTVGMTT